MNNHIVHVSFNDSRVGETEALYQFDRGQVLVFDNVNLPQTYRVIFSNGVRREGKSYVGGPDGVQIPDEYFLSGCNIMCWLILSDASSAEVEYVVRIPIRLRSPLSEEEQELYDKTIIDQLVSIINGMQEDVVMLEQRIPALGGWKTTGGEP